MQQKTNFNNEKLYEELKMACERELAKEISDKSDLSPEVAPDAINQIFRTVVQAALVEVSLF